MNRRDRIGKGGNLARLLLAVVMLVAGLAAGGCQELEEAIDNNADIIVRNSTSQDLWVEVDGSRRGKISTKGNAENVWDNAPEGVHTMTAYSDASYSRVYCRVETSDLRGDADFDWYLDGDGSYSGSRSGACR